MKAYKEIITLKFLFFFLIPGFSQTGTIKVQKEGSMEIFGLQSNRSGSPQSFIILIDDSKAVFVNSYFDAQAVWEKHRNGEKIDGRILPGMYKREGAQIFIFLAKGVQFKGSKINDALYLIDYTGEQVVFYKVYL